MAEKIVVQESKSLWLGYVIIAIALAGLCAGGYLLYKQMAPALPGASGTGTDPLDSPKAETGGGGIIQKATEAVKAVVKNVTNSSAFPLHTGSRGSEVTMVQKYLNTRYNSGLTEDGIWGSNTNKAMFTNAGTVSVSQAEYTNMLSWLSSKHIYITGAPATQDPNA